MRNPTRLIRSLPIPALLLAGLLSACLQDDRSAGVDEFPNSVYARIGSFMDEGEKSGGVNSVPPIADSLLNGPDIKAGGAIAIGAKVSAAAKRGAQAVPVLAKAAADAVCLGGMVSGTASTDTVIAGVRATTVATWSACLDAAAMDSISGNETLVHAKSVTTYVDGRVETAELSDADGDGIYNPVAGVRSKAAIVFTSLAQGVLEKTSLVLGPGPDGKFDTEPDNLIYHAEWIRSSGRDTLGFARYSDADGDSVAIDNGKPSLVDLEFYQQGPTADHPDAVRSRAWLRLLVRYGVEAKEARRVRFEIEDTLGRVESSEILNAQGGPDIGMGDTVEVRILTIGTAAKDTLDSLSVRLSMNLGADFDGKADDKIYAFDVASRKKLGEETTARFGFVSDKPMLSGTEAESGSLSMHIGYTDGTSLEVEGDISAEAMDVTTRDRAGKKLHVVWDRQGRVKSLTELP